MQSHPLSADFITKSYLMNWSPFVDLEHCKRVIEHLKSVWANLWKSDPHSYLQEVNKFCGQVESLVNNSLHTTLQLKLYSEKVFALKIYGFSLEYLELWADFCFDLKQQAMLLCKGHDMAQRIGMPLFTDFQYYPLMGYSRKNRSLLAKATFEWYEAKYLKSIARFYPEVSLCPGDGKLGYNIALYSAFLNISALLEVFSPTSLDIFDKIVEFCRTTTTTTSSNDTAALQQQDENSDFYLSLKCIASLKLCPSITNYGIHVGLNNHLSSRKSKRHLFEDAKGSLELLKRFIEFCEEFGSLYRLQSFPVLSFYRGKHLLCKFAKDCDKNKFEIDVEFYKTCIRICPSYLRSNDLAGPALMQKDAMFLLNVLEDARLLDSGVFSKGKVANFSLPFGKRIGSSCSLRGSGLKSEELARLCAYFKKNLLDRSLAFWDRCSAAWWLVDSLLGLDDEFLKLFIEISAPEDPNRNELVPIFVKKLYNVTTRKELEMALKITFSDVIIADKDAIEAALNGFASRKRPGNEFYKVVRPFIDPSNATGGAIAALISKMNFAGQRALAHLISTLAEGRLLLEFWDNRSKFKDHFRSLIFDFILNLLASESLFDSQIINDLLIRVREALQGGSPSVDLIKKILQVEPADSILYMNFHAIASSSSSSSSVLKLKNRIVALKYAEIVHEELIEMYTFKKEHSDIHGVVIDYCQHWGHLEGFISEGLLKALIRFANEILIDDELNIFLLASRIYCLFSEYAAFLSRLKTVSSINPFDHLNAHFKELITTFEASDSISLLSLSNLKKLTIIAKANESSGKFNLAAFSTKNVQEMAKYSQRASDLYNLLNKK